MTGKIEHGTTTNAATNSARTVMTGALDAAKEAGQGGDVPVGAALVIAATGATIATAGNRVERDGDPTAHAEILVIRAGAAALGAKRLTDCDLYVTLEPCAMCAQAIALARIRRLVFGAYDPKGGGVEHGARVFAQSTCHHKPEVIGGVLERECARLLSDFFAARR